MILVRKLVVVGGRCKKEVGTCFGNFELASEGRRAEAYHTHVAVKGANLIHLCFLLAIGEKWLTSTSAKPKGELSKRCIANGKTAWPLGCPEVVARMPSHSKRGGGILWKDITEAMVLR